MLIFLTALIVLILDQVSKYAIYYGFVVNTLGYAGSVTDLQALKASWSGSHPELHSRQHRYLPQDLRTQERTS